MSLNRVTLVGRLTRDPEQKFTSSGIAVCTLSIAVDRFTKDDQGKYETDFFNLVAWRRTAEFAAQYLQKGRLVSVDGRLQTRSWEDEKSGQRRTVVEIVAENLQGLDKPRESSAPPHPAGPPDSAATTAVDAIDEDDPFNEDGVKGQPDQPVKTRRCR